MIIEIKTGDQKLLFEDSKSAISLIENIIEASRAMEVQGLKGKPVTISFK